MEFLELLKVILLGIVEGITEWLPVSSTGHMILVDEFIKLNASDAFKEMFFVVIQLGAILAVVVLYFNKLFPFSTKEKLFIKKDTFVLWFKVLVASIPAAIIGLLFDDTIDALFYNYKTVALMLIVYGLLFIIIENSHKGKRPVARNLNELTYSMAFFIGMFQVLALIPGTSRSGATIIGGILIGASRFVATEFTFFLAIPVMFGASLLKLLKFGFAFTSLEITLLLTGTLVAFIISILAITFLINYLKRNDFKAFGYYRIALGLLVFVYFLLA